MCALACLAVLSRQNAPLYLRSDFSGDAGVGNDEVDVGASGAAAPSTGRTIPPSVRGGPARPMNFASLSHQFMIHASLDHVDEKVRDIVTRGAGAGTQAAGDAMYLGFLCPVEEMRMYGYMTNTGTKVVAMVEDVAGVGQQQREVDLKTLFASVHVLYAEHLLNPFARIGGEIASVRFDEGIQKCVGIFNGRQV